MSATGCGRPWMRAHFPGTINAAWRLAAGNVYAGNALATIKTWTSVGKLFLFTAAQWASAIDMRMEATFRATTGEVGVRLFNETDSVAVTNSEMVTSSSTLARARSSAITLVDGKEYRIQVGVNTGAAGGLVGGSIVGLNT